MNEDHLSWHVTYQIKVQKTSNTDSQNSGTIGRPSPNHHVGSHHDISCQTFL